MARSRFRYSRWDGTQVGFDLDAEAIFEELTDDLLYHGDLHAALRRLMQQGFNDRQGERLQGMRELMDKLREARRERLQQFDLGGVYDEIADELKEVVDLERRNIDRMSEEARQSGDQRRQELAEQSAADHHLELDMLPPDLAGQVKELQNYDFTSAEAQEKFDELMERLRQQLVQSYFDQMSGAMSNISPEQMARMKDMLAEQLLEDMDLRWQMDQLGSHLQQLFPQMGWDQRYDFSGQDPLGFAEAAQMMGELGDLDQLEHMLQNASSPGALNEVDIDKVRDLLGDDAARSLDRLAELAKMLEEAGLIATKEGRLELTPKGLRRIGQNALSDLFRKLAKDKVGRHELDERGGGHERSYQTKPYEFGDPFNLHIEKTIRNAIGRQGGGTPVGLSPDDFEIEQTENLVRSSTVLMLDLSLSMPMRDNFLPAKKVAMALHSLISSEFPRDFLGMVGFSEVARELRAEELPEVSWDFVYGTNMQHAFLLSRRMLARQSGTKQIIMITDGEPTAHFEAGMSQPFFSYPPVPETIEATLKEVARCTREGIRINTFMLDASPYLQSFIERLSKMNGGRAFFTTPETLGDYVLVDFVEQKRQMRRGRRAG